MPKPITQKSQLFGIVLISFIVLGISTLFSLSKEENTETSKACIHELEGKVSVLPSDKNQLVVVDKKGNQRIRKANGVLLWWAHRDGYCESPEQEYENLCRDIEQLLDEE